MALGPSVGKLFSVAWYHISLVEDTASSLAIVLFARSFSPRERTVLLPWVSVIGLERTQELGTQIRKD